MTLDLVRLDDRLIHGQVVVGWGHAIRVEAILLIDDAVNDSSWEQELYRMGVPPDIDVEFVSTAGAAEALAKWNDSPKRTIVLLGDVDALVEVCSNSTVVRQVNLGGLHEQDGRARRLRYVYLTDDETTKLRKLAASGIAISAQDVPTASPIPLEDVI